MLYLVMIFVSIAVLPAYCWIVWLQICSHRTLYDILKILGAISGRPISGAAVIAALNAVPYKQHMHAYALFRDPFKLYDPIVRDTIDNPRTDVVDVAILHGSDNEPGDGPSPRMN